MTDPYGEKTEYKKDPDEPSFNPHEIIAGVSPLPLWMIHSTRDEYVEEADYRRFDSVARDPKRLVLPDRAFGAHPSVAQRERES